MAKSKQAKMKDISYKTKCEVLDRQGNRSLTGVYLSDWNVSYHHVIYRSNEQGGGVGLAFNIVALTKEEHRWVHDHQPILVNGEKRYSWDEFNILMKNHLKLHYPHWSEEACRYHKYWDEQDYWDAIEGRKK